MFSFLAKIPFKRIFKRPHHSQRSKLLKALSTIFFFYRDEKKYPMNHRKAGEVPVSFLLLFAHVIDRKRFSAAKPHISSFIFLSLKEFRMNCLCSLTACFSCAISSHFLIDILENENN